MKKSFKMATTENEYYIRAILLLVEGGCYISKKVLYREHSGDLNKLLNSFKRELKRELHEKQIEKLFPPNGNTIVDTWDLQMLIIVVLRLFHNSLKREDIRKLRDLKLLRNEVQAHSSSVTLDVVQYEDIKGELTDALTSLASGFGENVQQECRSFINKYTSGPLDVMSAREYLKQLQNYDVLFKQVLEKIDSSKNDICTRLNATQKSLSDDVKNVSQQVTDLEKTLIEQLQRLDAGTCRKKIKVGMHVELSLGGPTEEWILLMERTLNDVFNEAYKTSGGNFEDIKKRVEDLLEVIKQNTTINYNGSKIKCIILMFECFKYSGLLDLLQYLKSQKYQRRLGALAETLSTHFEVDIPVTATSTISQACLQNALDDLTECEREKQETENCHSHPTDESKKSLKLAMECSSVEDLVYLWKMFQQGGAAYYLDRIADKLSEYFGKRITLSSSLNLEEFKEALEDTLESAEDADVGASNITGLSAADADDRRSKIAVLIKDDSSDEDVALCEFKRPQTTLSRHFIAAECGDGRKLERSATTLSRLELIKDTRIGEDVTDDEHSLDLFKRSPAASMKPESAVAADLGASKLTDLMEDVSIVEVEKDEAGSLRPSRTYLATWMELSDFIAVQCGAGRELGRSATTLSRQKLIKDTHIDEDVKDDEHSLDLFKRSPAASMKPESAIVFDLGASKLTDLMEDVSIVEVEKDEAESSRPLRRSQATWMENKTDVDKYLFSGSDKRRRQRKIYRRVRQGKKSTALPVGHDSELDKEEEQSLRSDKVRKKKKRKRYPVIPGGRDDKEEYKGTKEFEELLHSCTVSTKTIHFGREEEEKKYFT